MSNEIEPRKASDILLSLEDKVNNLTKMISVYDYNTKIILDRVNKIFAYIDALQKEDALLAQQNAQQPIQSLAAHERTVRLNTRIQHLEGLFRGSGRTSMARVRTASQPTSTPSTRPSTTWNSRSSTCGCTKNAARNSPPPRHQPRATTQLNHAARPQATRRNPGLVAPHLSQQVASHQQPSSCTNARNQVSSARRTPENSPHSQMAPA